MLKISDKDYPTTPYDEAARKTVKPLTYIPFSNSSFPLLNQRKPLDLRESKQGDPNNPDTWEVE